MVTYATAPGMQIHSDNTQRQLMKIINLRNPSPQAIKGIVGRKKINILLGADGKIAKAILYTFIKTNIISAQFLSNLQWNLSVSLDL